jgi:hypothetical protein
MGKAGNRQPPIQRQRTVPWSDLSGNDGSPVPGRIIGIDIVEME